MPRVVDGDNLLGTWPGRRRTDGEKRQLAREVFRLVGREGRRIVLVFDGSEMPGISLGADVLFSGPGRSADRMILDLLRREGEPRGWTVVTNDRALADQSRFLGASVESVREFRARLFQETAAEKPEAAGDVDYWLEQFGEDE